MGIEKIIYADKKIPDTIRLIKKTDYNVQITEIECRIPSITGLSTTAALNTFEKIYQMLVRYPTIVIYS